MPDSRFVLGSVCRLIGNCNCSASFRPLFGLFGPLSVSFQASFGLFRPLSPSFGPFRLLFGFFSAFVRPLSASFVLFSASFRSLFLAVSSTDSASFRPRSALSSTDSTFSIYGPHGLLGSLLNFFGVLRWGLAGLTHRARRVCTCQPQGWAW